MLLVNGITEINGIYFKVNIVLIAIYVLLN